MPPGTVGLPASSVGLVHVARPGETSPLCFQVRLFLMLVCMAVAAVLYVLLCSHACLRPCCWAPGEQSSPTAPTVLSFQGYSRVPDGKVRGDGAALGLVGQLDPPVPQFPLP